MLLGYSTTIPIDAHALMVNPAF